MARSRRGGRAHAPQVGSGSRCAGQRLGHASIDRSQVVRVDHLSPNRVINRRYVNEAVLAKRRIHPNLREAFLVAQRRLATLIIEVDEVPIVPSRERRTGEPRKRDWTSLASPLNGFLPPIKGMDDLKRERGRA